MTIRSRLVGQLEGWKSRLRTTPLYPHVRRFRTARTQQRRFDALLRRLSALPNDLDVPAEVGRQLDLLRPQRRQLPPALAEATVVTVGALGWERFGMWPSFARSAKVHRHFSDGLDNDVPYYCSSDAERRRRGSNLLRFVAEIGRETPVHVVFIYADASNLSPELFTELRDLGCWTVLMGLDDRHTFDRSRHGEVESGVESIAASPDLYWTTWRAGTLLHLGIGSRPWLGGFAADPAFYRPVVVERDIPVLFLGQRYGVRQELVERLQRLGVPLIARGHGWEGGFIDFEETIRLISRAEVVLGMSNVGALEDLAVLKGRDFEAPMCGACYLTQWSPELGDYFEVGKDLAAYGSIRQAAEEALALSRDRQRRDEMRRRALEVSLRRHTWEIRLREMYAVLRGTDQKP